MSSALTNATVPAITEMDPANTGPKDIATTVGAKLETIEEYGKAGNRSFMLACVSTFRGSPHTHPHTHTRRGRGSSHARALILFRAGR
jgi:hypothetical protein